MKSRELDADYEGKRLIIAEFPSVDNPNNNVQSATQSAMAISSTDNGSEPLGSFQAHFDSLSVCLSALFFLIPLVQRNLIYRVPILYALKSRNTEMNTEKQ